MENKNNKEQEKAAVAFAIHQYKESLHDHESGVLTIKKYPNGWGSVLNPRMWLAGKLIEV